MYNNNNNKNIKIIILILKPVLFVNVLMLATVVPYIFFFIISGLTRKNPLLYITFKQEITFKPSPLFLANGKKQLTKNLF